jgi:hypothetical protein
MRRPLLAVVAVAVLPLVTGCQGARCTQMGAAGGPRRAPALPEIGVGTSAR